MAKNFIDCEFLEVNGKDTFMKIKANAFGIGKVQFAFVKFDKETNKMIENMDVYMSIPYALLLAQDILSGRIATLAQAEKAKGAKYPGSVYVSPLGGVTEEKAKEKFGRTDGKAISRTFSISPGSAQPFIFTAEMRPGHTNEMGAIIPEKGKAEMTIRVPCDGDMLKKVALTLKTYIQGYVTSQFVNNEFEAKFTPNNKS
jgi:hypothetical protein